MAEEHKENGWGEYKRLVLKQLEDGIQATRDLDAKCMLEMEKLSQKLDTLSRDYLVTKTKIVTWGAFAGLVVSVLTQLAFVIVRGML
jgi:hypothetical protein